MPFPSRPTILDIAREAGVSPITVSYMLSGPSERIDALADGTAQRIRLAMETLGYIETDPTPYGSRRRTNRVLLLVCRMSSPWSQMLAASTERALAEHGYTLGVAEGEGPDDIRRNARLLHDEIVDGIVVETEDEHVPVLREVASAGLPVVTVGPKAADPMLDVVTADDSNAIREAMLHLVAHRYENFVLMSPRDDSNRDYRTTVARDQLRALGVRADRIETIYSAHDRIEAFAVMSRHLARMPLPAAVITGSDASAIGVLWACLRAGIRVPRDVAVLGHGNAPEVEITSPPISSIGPETQDLRNAAQLIVSRIAQPSRSGRHVVEPWVFYPREST